MRWVFLLLLSGNVALGQNLVTNPSFEQLPVCPSAYPSYDWPTGWNVYRPNGDFFHACATEPAYQTPGNGWGYQVPATGDGYAGVFSFHSSSNNANNELIGCDLTTPLAVGTKYFVSFKVSLSATATCAVDHLGIRFSTKKYCYSLDSLLNTCDSTPAPITNSAQVFGTQIISDTTDWVQIGGSFIADSSYQYAILGNQFDTNLTNYDLLYGNTQCTWVYYYIDDVCVSTDSLTCFGQTGITSNEQSATVSLFPNPSSGTATLQFSNPMGEMYSLTLYNALGVEAMQATGIRRQQYVMDVEALPGGIYFWVLKSGHRVAGTGKLVIE